jgi:hypothetical protein
MDDEPEGEPTALGAMNEGVSKADGQKKAVEKEQKAVKAANDEYAGARQFDEGARKQYNRDRRYAAGKSDKHWKSNANIIGSHIDILKSFTYAQNPDVSCQPSVQAGMTPTEDDVDFAETMQIVISKLWKRAQLKKRARRMVGSTLTVGPGIIKALMYSDKRQNPQLERELKDMRDNLARVEQLETEVGETAEYTDEERAEKVEEMENQIKGLEAKVEKLTSKGLCIDFIRAEDFQCSTDVACIADHLEADWNSNDLYVRKNQLRTRFPRLTAADVKEATTYYQAAPKIDDPKIVIPGESSRGDEGSADGAFTKSAPDGRSSGTVTENGKSVEFAKVVEMWCRSENVIKTFVDGVKRWAVEPYAPPQGSKRFYPYFNLEFYEVDGERHPQSLTDREWKLQDEYASRRSNGAEVRERSVPMKVFNNAQIDPKEAEKFRKGENMELVGVRLTDPLADVNKAIGVVAAPRIDWQAYDTADVQRDMEVVSGVQEAQQQAPKPGVTATAVETSNQGFASRTGADRDALEDMLNDLAVYTAETALQALTVQDVQRLAGPQAFWPGEDPVAGIPAMDYEDVSEILEIEIVAGSTGKPNERADKEAVATLMPIVKEFVIGIPQMEATGDPVVLQQAKGLRNLLEWTLKSMDNRMSIDQILPPMAVPKVPLAGDPAAGAAPGQSGPAGGPPVEGTPTGNGTVNNPQAAPPMA